MKKIKYTKPSIKVIQIKKEDIIITSGPAPETVETALFGTGKKGVNVG